MPSPLRLCFVVSYFHPVASGAERQALLQAKELVRRGHTVRVLTRALPGRPTDETLDGVQVVRTIRPIEAGPLFGVSFISSLAESLVRDRESYDLIHCHQALWEAAAVGLVHDRLWRPSVVQPAASGSYGEWAALKQTRGRGLLRRLILRNDRFVAISAELSQELQELGVPADRITQLASGVDCEVFSPGRSSREDELPPRPRVLFLGRLHPQKNLSTLIEAWPAVAARHRANLLIVGQGPERARLEALADRLHCRGSVHFYPPTAEAVDFLRAADLFVLPSVAEGSSNALLEALAVGLPCLASRIGGNVDLIEPRRTGWLVEAADAAAWSAALDEALGDLGEARRMGHAAREATVERFSIRVVVDGYERLYRQLLES